MAPRRGGGGGSSSSTGSSSCYNSDGELYPCSVPFYSMYGDFDGPLYSTTDIHGQLGSYACWIVIILVILAMSSKSGARLLQLAMLSFISSFVFLCTRYALLLTGLDVPVAFRYESSVVVLMWRIGMVALLISTLPSLKGIASKIYLWAILAIYIALSITIVVYDFIISSIAVKEFKLSPSDYGWKITDRDFGLTLTQAMLDALEGNARYYGDSGWVVGYDNDFVHNKLYDVYNGQFHQERTQQARIGVAGDIVALILVVSMIIFAIAVRSKGAGPIAGKKWLIAANFALLPTLLFRVIISTAFVLRNWDVLAEVEKDIEIKNQFITDITDTYDLSYRGEDFGRIYVRYNTTLTGFPIIQAVVEPLGVVLACIAAMMWWRTRAKHVHQTNHVL